MKRAVRSTAIVRGICIAAAALAYASHATANGRAPGAVEAWCRPEGVGLARCFRSPLRCGQSTHDGTNADCRRLDRTMFCFEIVARGEDAPENGLLECHATPDACKAGRNATARGADGARKPSACEAVGTHAAPVR